MAVAGISSSSLFNYNAQSIQSKKEQFAQEFQQLGQDLQSGNLSAAQSDFATLQPSGPQANQASQTQAGNPLSQDFTQLAKDLKSGDVSAAQQDYAKIQQDFQSQAGTHAHHHHHGGGGGSAVSQLLQQLGQELQSGNLSAAQQAYGTLQQDLQQAVQNNGLFQTAASGSNGVSVNA